MLTVRFDNGYLIVVFDGDTDLVWFSPHKGEAPFTNYTEFVGVYRVLFTWATHKHKYPDITIPLSPEIIAALNNWRNHYHR